MLVEATLDFPEEEIDFLRRPTRAASSQRIAGAAATRCWPRARQGALLREGIHVVLAGQPNVGKSSLLNALAGAELAIVTPIAGTTRDKVSETIQIEGVPLHVIDTAGLRDDACRRGRAHRHRAQLGRDRARRRGALPARPDAPAASAGYDAAEAADRSAAAGGARRAPCCTCSTRPTPRAGAARCGRRGSSCRRAPAPGLERCAQALLELAGWQAAPEGVFIARARHVQALRARESTWRWPPSTPPRPTPRSTCSPKSCAWRTTRSARSPARSAPTTCWARSSAASASASDPTCGDKRSPFATNEAWPLPPAMRCDNLDHATQRRGAAAAGLDEAHMDVDELVQAVQTLNAEDAFRPGSRRQWRRSAPYLRATRSAPATC